MNAQTQNMPAQSPAKAFQVYMQKYKSQLEMALPKHMSADRMMRLSLTEFSKNPKLQECTHNTIFGSIVTASQLGLEIGVNGQGYLVPYWNSKKRVNECQFIPGWKGLVDLAQRGGRSSVWTGAVYEGDEFDYMLGDSPYCRHKPCGEFEVSKLTHVYAIGRVKDSEMPIIEVWPVKKVHAHFETAVIDSLKQYHYSKKHFEAYARKVALLQVLKYMPQSIELSNAMEVSNAVEQGKGVTIDGDFVTVESTPQEDMQDQSSQNSTQNDVGQHMHQGIQQLQSFNQEEVDYAPTFAQIKKGILTAKSPAHLDVMEEQAMDHANKDERKQLMQLIKAQSQKFQPAAEVASAKKPEPIQEEAPPVEVEVKKPTSAELKKSFAKALNSAKSEREVAAIESQIESSFDLSEGDKKYLASNVQQMYEKFSPAETAQQTPAVNEIKSNSIAGGLKTAIQDAANLEALTAVAQTIRDNKPKLTVDHMAEVLQVYAARKKFLEDQQDMFADVQEPWVEGAIKRIEAAKNQDDINAEYSDPMCEELSDKDKQRLDLAAQKREAELFG